MQLVGLKSCHAGNPLPKGVKDTGAEALLKALTKITQPYQGGVTFNFSNPTSNKFYREGEADPFFSMRDPTSGSKEVTWNVADFDDDTLEMYFGTTEPAEGKLYEGEKAFVFDAESGVSIAFARLKYTASLSGSLNTSDPLQIAVSADVLAPEQGGIAWWPIATPEYTQSAL
jgi:hypothetical protein|uniref:Uncharacterized protein n=1 Tax=Siphoviridae sp. ctxdc10 TaxID=2825740 RepID=A0A8S5TSH1_9CAUD|nr:MAG TPA: hypothetical protein [Siphoviridae sp. ctxdc10]